MAKWKEPELENEEAKEKVQQKSDKGVQEIDTAKDKTESKTKSLGQEMQDKDKTELNENQNANYARGEGQYKPLNDKSYESTLRLMRRADKYNNKPLDHMFSVGTRHTGGVKDIGVGYERPRIESEETRTMERNRQLDLNQKQLAQELQAAVNRKDLDAFIKTYEQLFGIQLTRMQAEMALRQWMQQQQATNILTKDVAEWQKKFQRAFDEETLGYLFELSQTNNQLSQLLTNAMYGLPTPSLDERLMEELQMDLIGKYKQDGNLSNYAANKKAMQTILALEELNNNATASTSKRTQKLGNRYEGYKEGKEIVNEAKGMR